MNDQLISIIGKLIAAIFVGVVTYLAPKAKAWFEVHTSESSQEQIKLLITSFAEAAEQLLHDEDPDGSKRMSYVKNQLTAVGVGLTSEVISMIEGAVWEINNQNRKNLSFVDGVDIVPVGISGGEYENGNQ